MSFISLHTGKKKQKITVDFEIKSRLNALENNPKFINSNNNNNNNLTTPSPPSLFQPPSFNHHYLFNCHNHLHLEHHLQHLDSFNRHHYFYKITLISQKQKQQQQQCHLVILQLKKTLKDSKKTRQFTTTNR